MPNPASVTVALPDGVIKIPALGMEMPVLSSVNDSINARSVKIIAVNEAGSDSGESISGGGRHRWQRGEDACTEEKAEREN